LTRIEIGPDVLFPPLATAVFRASKSGNVHRDGWLAALPSALLGLLEQDRPASPQSETLAPLSIKTLGDAEADPSRSAGDHGHWLFRSMAFKGGASGAKS